MYRKYSKKKKTMFFFIALIMLAVICLPTFSISAYANTVDLSTAVNCPSNFKGVQFNDGLSNISNLTLKGLSFKKVVSIPGRPTGARYNGDVCYKLKNGNKEISLWAYYEISGSNLSTDDKAQRIIQAAYNAFHDNTNVEVSSVNIYTDYDHAPAVSDGKISMSGEGIKERLTYDPNGTFGDHVTYWMGAKSNNLNISIYKDGDGNELLLSDILGTEPDVTSRRIEDEVDKSLLHASIEKLNKRERNIMELRFRFSEKQVMVMKKLKKKLQTC